MKKILAGSNSVHRDGGELHFVPSSFFPHRQVPSIWAVDHPPKSSQRDLISQSESGFSLFHPGKNRGMSCGKTCREDRDDEWMGVSLARQPKADGQVLVSATGRGRHPEVERLGDPLGRLATRRGDKDMALRSLFVLDYCLNR